MRLLYFYPENPLLKNQGNNARALALLEYFKSRAIEVDFVGVYADNFQQEDISNLKNERYIKEGYLLKSLSRKKNQLRYFFMYSLPRKIFKKIKEFDRRRFGQEKLFEEIAMQKEYDFILISYAYWANLIDNIKEVKPNVKFVIDTHDFLTSQFQHTKDFQLGKYFETEIRLLNKFDEVLVISNEEKYVFSQFLDQPVSIVTHTLKTHFDASEIAKKYDIVYVASNNEHNIKAAKWFFTEVYPKLDKNIQIVVVGRVVSFCPEGENITKIAFIEDLDSIYEVSKIAICPMLSGTGLKIKVVEALSYGLPVVCNERGIDGLLNKTNNGCLMTNDPSQFANYVTQLLQDKTFYEKHAQDSKSFFIANHSIEATYTELDHIFTVDQ